ncbi:MAG TPA: aminoglycoside adenylyltransferase domain-containing protein, partial [Herpetosiphonaceae bacterium]
EQGGELFLAPLESGWAAQCWSLRERGLLVAGPDPRSLAGPIAPDALRPGAAAIAGEWATAARDDPSWLDWLRERPHHRFVVQTLCRMLYSLATGEVASKPQAAAWARQALGEPWAGLIRETMAAPDQAPPDGRELDATIAFIAYVQSQAS